MTSPDTYPAAEHTPAPAVEKVGSTVALRAGAGPGYVGEWGLFCDYTTATDQPTLPTTVEALTGFLTALPARPVSLARRVRAIAAAHRHAGYLLARPETGPGAPRPARPRRGPDPGLMIAACPTCGWPTGLAGRRDAFLIVLTETLGYPHPGARELLPADITVPTDDADDADDAPTPSINGQAVPTSDDSRTCPACAVVRWLDILGAADGLGRGSARMALTARDAPTAASPHRHRPAEPARWRGAAVLLPAIDQHGWHDDYRPMTTRAIRTRLALAARRAATADTLGEPASAPSGSTPTDESGDARSSSRAALGLDEVLTTLDALADDADALNTRIKALIELGQ